MGTAARALAIGAVLILAPLAATLPASGAAYPTHPIRLIVPYAAAGPTDVIARILAQKLSEAWGQQIYTANIRRGAKCLEILALDVAESPVS